MTPEGGEEGPAVVVACVGCGWDEGEARDRLSISGNAAAVLSLLMLVLLVLVEGVPDDV